MFRAPKRRKRQFSKNRSVVLNRRCPSADVSAEGVVRGKFGGEVNMRLVPTGVERRESMFDCECRGAGKSGFVMLVRPGGARHLYDCCFQLLQAFGIEWCLQARFVNCRFTVAEVLNKAKDRSVKLNDCVRDSEESSCGWWMLDVPSFKATFDPEWCQWCEPTNTADFSSGEKQHTYATMRRKHTKRDRQHHDLPFSNSRT